MWLASQKLGYSSGECVHASEKTISSGTTLAGTQ